MLDREAESGRRAIIEHVNGVAIEADGLGKAVDRRRDLVEGVRFVRHIGVAEAREIGSDDMETVGEQRDQVAEHMAGGGEAVQQQQLRGARSACFAVEHIAIVDLGGPIMDGGHDACPFAQKLGGPQPLTASPIASPMMSTTVEGAVTGGVWSTGCERIRAFMRAAMKR